MMRSPTRRLYLCGFFTIAVISIEPCESQEWTRFRGPNGTGVIEVPGLPGRFTESDFNWKVELPGGGHSSPVIYGKRIFLTSADATKAVRYILCLDADSGKQLWAREYAFKSYHRHQFNSAASSSLTVDSERVYAAWSTHDSFAVCALNHEGKDVWSRDFGSFPTQHGGGASPMLAGDILVVTKDEEGGKGQTLGLNCKTGETVWKLERPSPDSSPYPTPVLRKGHSGEELLLGTTTYGVTAVNPKTGKVLWESGKFTDQRIVGGLIEAGGLIIATSGNGAGLRKAVAVKPGPNPSVAYEISRGSSYVPTPICYNGLLFFWHDSGVVLCVKPESGQTIWQERVGGGSYFGSPVCINGKLYAMSAKGELVVIDAAEKFNLISRLDLGEMTHATPAVSGGVLYLRTLSHLISVGGKKPAAN